MQPRLSSRLYPSPQVSPRRTCRILGVSIRLLTVAIEGDDEVPPMKRVSPVNTTRSSPSSMNQQIESCVWQGVCRAVTLMFCPILKLSSCPGVFVTAWQSLPPITDRFLKWVHYHLLVYANERRAFDPTISELPPEWSEWLASSQHLWGLLIPQSGLLMGVHDSS